MNSEKNQESPRYISIGYSVGVLGDSNGHPIGSQKQPAWWIRAGRQFYALDPASTKLWLRSQATASLPALEAAAAHLNVDSHKTIDDMLKEQLLALLPSEGDSISGAFWNLRPLPQGVGLGQSIENPSNYQIGTLYGEIAVTCDFVGYIIWTFCDGQRSLRSVIKATAQHLNCDEMVVTANLIQLLPLLLKTRVVGLDCEFQSGESDHVVD